MLLVDLLEVVERLVRAIVPLGFHGMPFLIFYANPVCLEMSGLQALDDVSCGQIFLVGWRAGFGSAACLISEMPFDVWSGCSACWAISFPISFDVTSSHFWRLRKLLHAWRSGLLGSLVF